MNARTTTIALLLTATAVVHADTTQTGPNSYTIDEGVTFNILSIGSSSFIVNWEDGTGMFSALDPTITLSAGETYVFDNQTFSHPLRITDDTLPVSGTDGSFTRTTSDITVINNASLQPIADFTSDPQPQDDPIIWTPGNDDAGEYYYTCLVLSHAGMTGKIIVEAPKSCPADLTGDGNLDFFDVSAFLSAYNAMDPAADFTDDGVYNFFDVSAFLGLFNAGCP